VTQRFNEFNSPPVTIARLRRDWNSTTYAFFEPTPTIAYIKDRRVHIFKCLAQNCKGRGPNPRCVNRFLGTQDSSSTGNLRKHAKICFGAETIAAADKTKDLALARGIVSKSGLKNQSITAVFERVNKERGAVTYSHTQHTKTEIKCVNLFNLLYFSEHPC
jgi:hypothetical protein